jgi:hypothetical protein
MFRSARSTPRMLLSWCSYVFTACKHRCTANHRTYRKFALCTFPRAAWVQGEGPYASLAWCRELTVQLFATEAAALAAKDTIDSTACGGACSKNHEVVQLAK